MTAAAPGRSRQARIFAGARTARQAGLRRRGFDCASKLETSRHDKGSLTTDGNISRLRRSCAKSKYKPTRRSIARYKAVARIGDFDRRVRSIHAHAGTSRMWPVRQDVQVQRNM